MIAELHDGTRLEFPDGTDPAVIQRTVKSVLAQRRQESEAQFKAEMDPTKDMGAIERGLAAAGGAITDLARGAGQWVGAVDRADVAEARRLDAPLMNTTAGKVGNFVGKAIPVAAASLAAPATIPAAAAIGAVSGALEPSESTAETLKNITLGGAAGAAGQYGGQKLADWLAKRSAAKAAEFTAQQTANAQKLGAARAAAKEGYVIPPSDVQPQGPLMEALGGLSGKIKTAQQASAKNQQVTDALARKAVGLNPDDALTTQVLAGIRQQAGQAYDKFRTIGTIQADATYNTALDGVEQTLKGAARSFPGLKSDEVGKLVQTMRQPQFDAGDAIDATKVLREMSESAYIKGDKGLAKAARKVSDALEDAIDRQIQNVAPNAIDEFRQARQLIAKSYSVEKALNSQTGSVSAPNLAAQLKKGKPLSGELKTIAEAGEAFPKALQALKEDPKSLSPLDFGAAGLGLVSSGGNPLAALGLVARPATREALLSQLLQQRAMRDLSGPGASRLANPIQRLAAPASITVANSRQ